jgi:hypothetical protein
MPSKLELLSNISTTKSYKRNSTIDHIKKGTSLKLTDIHAYTYKQRDPTKISRLNFHSFNNKI